MKRTWKEREKAFGDRELAPVIDALVRDPAVRRDLAQYAVLPEVGADALTIGTRINKIIERRSVSGCFLSIVLYRFGLERGLITIAAKRK